MSVIDKFEIGDLVEVSGVLGANRIGVVVRAQDVPWDTEASYYLVYANHRVLGWIPQYALKKLA